MTPEIRSVGIWGHPNIRTWEPDDPATVAEMVLVDIGAKSAKGADTFWIKVATPAGLGLLEPSEGIVAVRPLLVMARYDFHELWSWLDRTVRSCTSDSWPGCLEKLKLHFGWEFDGYREGRF